MDEAVVIDAAQHYFYGLTIEEITLKVGQIHH